MPSKIIKVAVIALGLALLGSAALSQTKTAVPKFEVDPGWPKPLPEGWITGRLGSVCSDSHDHIIVTNRRDITDEEKETSKQAPSVLIFDLAGNLVTSWDGDWDKIPGVIHGCYADKDNNIWLTGNGDGIWRGRCPSPDGFHAGDQRARGRPSNHLHTVCR